MDYAHGNALTTFLCGALNYQVTHHLFPTVSQYHYPAIAPIIQDVCRDFQVLAYRTTYHACLPALPVCPELPLTITIIRVCLLLLLVRVRALAPNPFSYRATTSCLSSSPPSTPGVTRYHAPTATTHCPNNSLHATTATTPCPNNSLRATVCVTHTGGLQGPP